MEGIEAHPTVVTPNQQEAERLLGRTLLTRTHYLEAAEQIRHRGRAKRRRVGAAHRDALQLRAWRGIELHHQRIMAGDDVALVRRKRL